MKKYVEFLMIISMSFFCFGNSKESSNLVLLDQIEAVVIGQKGVDIITKSDLDRPSLGGGYRTLEDRIFESKIILDAKKHEIPDDEDAVETGIEQMKREHNLSQEDLENIFKGDGYTMEDGRKELLRMQTRNTMMDMKVRSNLFIPQRDIEDYYHAHPEIIEATYTLERFFMPFLDGMTRTKQKAQIEKYNTLGKKIPKVERSATFTINHSDIAEHKSFIYSMEPGDLSLPEQVASGFEWFCLISKTPQRHKSLEESYNDIITILRREKYEETMKKYCDQLAEHVSIIYF